MNLFTFTHAHLPNSDQPFALPAQLTVRHFTHFATSFLAPPSAHPLQASHTTQHLPSHASSEIHTPMAHSPDFFWLDFELDAMAAQPDVWLNDIHQHTGILIDEFHLADILNPHHPSAFDITDDYQILIIRTIQPNRASPTSTQFIPPSGSDPSTPNLLSPTQLHTQPTVLIIAEQGLITLRAARHSVLDSFIHKFSELAHYDSAPDVTHSTSAPTGIGSHRPLIKRGLPTSPLDLALKLLNGMIDQYLALRAPLTAQIEHWQHALLQDKRRFNQWSQLLSESVALQKLESLCEEQIDALQELRDEFIDHEQTVRAPHQRRDLVLVRMNDLIEHAWRVQKHAARLESALKSAVDLHFSASSNQTNETMRFLAILTSVFAPLTLLTGIYGMNFDIIPGLHNPRGFWFLLVAMFVCTVALLYYFQRQRIVNRSEQSLAQLLSLSGANEQRAMQDERP